MVRLRSAAAVHSGHCLRAKPPAAATSRNCWQSFCAHPPHFPRKAAETLDADAARLQAMRKPLRGQDAEARFADLTEARARPRLPSRRRCRATVGRERANLLNELKISTSAHLAQRFGPDGVRTGSAGATATATQWLAGPRVWIWLSAT